MKKCSTCGELKDNKNFYKSKVSKDGYMYLCIKCHNKYTRKYNKTEKQREKSRQYMRSEAGRKSREKYKKSEKYRENLKNYCKSEKFREYRRDYVKNKKDSDIYFKLKLLLRDRLNSAIKNNCKSGSAVNDLGCSIYELKKHLEGMFTEGMCWGNHGRNGWHIDHIKPLAKFDLTDRRQLLEACHYTNLQPLWAKDNFNKRNKDYGWNK